jgi:DNA polymerase-1
MPATEAPTLYVLDGTYYIFRAFYALRSLSNSKGLPTNGLFAFTSMLLKTIRDQGPQYLAVAFDPPGRSFRGEVFDDYKANRAEMPEELKPQMPIFRDIVTALRIPILEVPGFEADDVIATLAKRGERDGINVVMLSGDKDLYQVVDEHTTMVDTMRDKVVTVQEVKDRFQVMPELVPDVQALCGDSSDNIPGVPGIGEKTAGKLIAEFGGLEALLANIDRVSGKKRKENLAAHAEQVRVSRQLTGLRTDAPIDMDLSALEVSAPDFARFDELCAELEFNRFPAQLRELFAEAAEEDAVSRAVDFEYETVLGEERLGACLAAIREAGRLSFDLETTSVDALEAKIVGFALAWRPGHGVYVPVAHRGLTAPKQLACDAVLAQLKPLLKDEALPKYGQHTKYEITILRRYGVELRGIACDTMLAAYLLDPNRRRYKLDILALELLQHRTITYADVAGSGKNQRRFDEVEVEAATRYASEDADVTLRLADVLLPKLGEAGLREVHDEIEVPLTGVLARMETTGIRIDTGFLKELAREFAGRLEEIEARVYEAADERFTVKAPAPTRACSSASPRSTRCRS